MPLEDVREKNDDETSTISSAIHKWTPHVFVNSGEVSFGVPFGPMLSEKTSFVKCLANISKRHRDAAASDDNGKSATACSLSFQHPAFTAERKLDGERMIAHVSKEGVVKMHSRNANWFR